MKMAPSTLLCLSILAVAASANQYQYPDANALIQKDEQQGQAQQKKKPEGLQTCIDDSDCKGLGPGQTYRCFLYICYPWKKDDEVPADERRTTCRKSNECDVRRGEECVRHHDRRNVNRGLCMQLNHCYDGDLSACQPGQGCCNDVCCEEKYHRQFKELPCITDNGCQDLQLGQYCCPRDNGTSVCCDTNPNPPTYSPTVKDAGAANRVNLGVVASVAAAVVLAKMAL